MLLEWLEKEFSELGESLGIPFQSNSGSRQIKRLNFYNYPEEILPALSGNYKGFPLQILVRKVNNKSIGNFDIHNLDMRIDLTCNNPVNRTLRLYQEGNFAGISKLFGMQDIRVGDKNFDPYFIIQSNSESFISYVLEKDLRQQLARFRNHFKGQVAFGDLSVKSEVKARAKRYGKPDEILDYEMTLSEDQHEEPLTRKVDALDPNQHKLRLHPVGFIPTNPVLRQRLIRWVDLLHLMAGRINSFQ